MVACSLRAPFFGLALMLAAFVVASCESEPEPPIDNTPDWPALEGGTLRAGAAGGYLDLPVGVPLGGFTARDEALGDADGPDQRDSDYTTDFVPSGGWQTRVPLDALWLENDHEAAVIVRIDLIYSFDDLTEAIGERLTEAVGRDLTDSVFTVTSHSHSSYGTFTKAMMLWFGGDFFLEEIFDRIVDQAVGIALEAYESRVDAAIGLGVMPLFDPVGDDTLFRDRREENDSLPRPDGSVPDGPDKDERATLLRVDSADGDPIAALFAFGIHGTIMGSGNTLVTTEAGGHVATLLQQRHAGPRWIFAQGAGGDASPAGRFDGFARMEWIAEEAADRLVELYESVELTTEPILLDPVQRYVTQGRHIRVTRNGTVDLRYLPWDDAWDEEDYRPDLRIYNDDGSVASPLDEFWAHYGAALCGEPEIDISLFGLDVPLPMYQSCLDFEAGFSLFRIAFRPHIETRDDFPLPLPESRTTLLGALGLRDIPVTVTGEGTAIEDVVIAFAPGEPTTLWTQYLRHRAATEAGVQRTVLLGYAMDHEGYLLTVEDWLLAGYEAAIVWWGPLQGEYVLEQMLPVLALADSDVKEDPAWPDFPTETWYPEWPTDEVVPDASPDAGDPAEPLPDYLFTRDGAMPLVAGPAAQLRRIQDVARWSFWGNDPATGLVTVTVEREGESGWQPLTTPSGEAVSDALPDIIVTYTPYPLVGTDVEVDPLRDHLYHVEWQVLDAWLARSGIAATALGNYRLVASGGSRDPADSDYPYDTIPWAAVSSEFAVVPADVLVSAAVAGDELSIDAAYAPASRGFRLLHRETAPSAPTPLYPALSGVTVTATPAAGGPQVTPTVSSLVDGEGVSHIVADGSGLSVGNWTIAVDDGHGNLGSVELLVQ